MNKVSKNRYEEIKGIALECINEFYANKNGFNSIVYYLNKYATNLENIEEQILFRNMVLFPNSKNILDEYNKDKDIKTLSKKYLVKKGIIQSKLSSISCYEVLYERSGLLNISSIDILSINLEIVKFNKQVDDTIKMLNERKNGKINILKK